MSKGKDFERVTARDLSLWLTTGKDRDLVWYTKSSGGRATRRIKTNQESKQYDHGDLGPDGPGLEWFFDAFSVELKTGYGTKNKKSTTLWSLLDIIDSQQQMPMFYNFWYQATNDADVSKREPILIFRRNRRLPCIAMHSYIFNVFLNQGNQKESSSFLPYINIVFDDHDDPPVSICNIRQFFDYTWGIIDANFIQTKINRVIIVMNKR